MEYTLQLDERKSGHFRFFSEVIKFRQSHTVFRQETFIGKVYFLTVYMSFSPSCMVSCDLHEPFSFVQNEVTWHENNWDNYESKFLAFT